MTEDTTRELIKESRYKMESSSDANSNGTGDNDSDTGTAGTAMATMERTASAPASAPATTGQPLPKKTTAVAEAFAALGTDTKTSDVMAWVLREYPGLADSLRASDVANVKSRFKREAEQAREERRRRRAERVGVPPIPQNGQRRGFAPTGSADRLTARLADPCPDIDSGADRATASELKQIVTDLARQHGGLKRVRAACDEALADILAIVGE